MVFIFHFLPKILVHSMESPTRHTLCVVYTSNRLKRDKLVEFDWFSTVVGADCVIINWYVHFLHRPLMDVSEMEINNLAPKGLGGCLIFRH